MSRFKYGVCEKNYPVWGSLAMEMAHEQGYEGIEITDGGGYLQPHPMNKGLFVEVERLKPDKRRMDAVPLRHPIIQDEYLEAQARTGIEITGVYLYFLNHQGFMSSANDTLTGRDCLDTIRNAVIAASEMGIPSVSVPAMGMFGTAKLQNAADKLDFAVKMGREYGVKIYNSFDTDLEWELKAIRKSDGYLKVDLNTLDPEIYNRGRGDEYINTLGKDRIGQVKVRDMVADREGFLTSGTGRDCLLGYGDSGWKTSLLALKDIGYEGWILSDSPFNSHLLNRDGENYDTLAVMDLNTLKNLLEQGD